MDYLAILSALFFAVGCAPLAFFAFGCCCSPCTICASGTTTPEQVQVTIAGLANGACLSCASLHGTYILERTSSVLLPCRWEESSAKVCSSSYFGLTLSGGSLLLRTTFSTAGSPTTLSWSSSAAGFDGCSNWSAFSLPGVSGVQCDVTSSTASVTAL
jgi:hypothetical protein